MEDCDPTCLQTKADADTESQRRGYMFGVQRKTYTYEGTPSLMLESLGSPQFLQHKRYGLQSGKVGQLINIETDFLKATVTLGVFA